MDARDVAFACAVHGVVACALMLWPAAQMAQVADAVVVGSRIIEELEKSPAGEELARVEALVRELRRGVDSVGSPT